MSLKTQTRADARALFGAALIGTAVGLILGGAYLAGGMAQTATQHARSTRLAAAAAEGFSETALKEAVLRMDAGAQSVARRHDPFTVAGDAARDRQSSILAARLERKAQATGSNLDRNFVLRASLSGGFNPAAQPFHMAGALDQARELECLSQAVYYEARGEGPRGQQAVAQVVLNRVRHPAFPKSVCGVVFQRASARGGCQFSFACDGSMRRGREGGAWTRAEKIAARALSGAVMGEVGSATHFHTTAVAPNWGPRMMRVAQVGLHVFYKFNGRARPATYMERPQVTLAKATDVAPTVLASLAPAPTAPNLPQGGLYMAGSALAEAVDTATLTAGPAGDVKVAPANAKALPIAAKTAPAAEKPAKSAAPAVEKVAEAAIKTAASED